MSLEAAARRCCVVEHRGRRYLVSAPTLATVVMASGLFPEEIAGFAHVAVESPDVLSGSPDVFRGILGDLIRDTSDGRAGEVLETCTELIGGSRGDVLGQVSQDRELAIVLGTAVLSLCDVPRCFKGAGWERLGTTPIDQLVSPKPHDWVDPSDGATGHALVKLSKEHSCSPMDVMAWPFEVVLMVNEANAFLSDPEARERAAAASKPFPLELLHGIASGYQE
jgi:hypothetical protein